MSDMLKSFVKKELEEQIKNKYSHIKYPAGMYAKVVQVIKKNDVSEYVLRILDKNLNEDSSFAEIPGVRTELELNKGDIAVILLLYGGFPHRQHAAAGWSSRCPSTASRWPTTSIWTAAPSPKSCAKCGTKVCWNLIKTALF